MDRPPPYDVFFISDSAVTLDFGSLVDEGVNQKVIALFNHLRAHPLPKMIEAVAAYSSVTIYFDVPALRKIMPANKRVFDWITEQVQGLACLEPDILPGKKKVFQIPVCYDELFALDMVWVAERQQLSYEDIIRLHTSKQYRVFMLGFLPGFAYLGEVDPSIAVPRKPQPQLIPAGSVGIAGRQTGVYPFACPGGWRIIGRTPMKLFDMDSQELCPLRAGDYVQFYPISRDEFANY